MQEYTYQKYAYKNGFKATYVDKDVFASGLIHVTQLLPPDKDHSCDFSYSCISGRMPKVSGLQGDRNAGCDVGKGKAKSGSPTYFMSVGEPDWIQSC